MRRNTKIGLVIGVVVVVGLGLLIWQQQSNIPDYIPPESSRPVAGNPQATIVVEEFSDFQCPACKSAEVVVQDVLASLGDQVAFYYKHFPLTAIHPYAFQAALAAECANDQGKFWEYHNVLFQNQPNFSAGELMSYAGGLELDTESFSACLKSRAWQDVVRADMREGDGRKVNSTPSFFVNGEAVADWRQLKSVIQGQLIGG